MGGIAPSIGGGGADTSLDEIRTVAQSLATQNFDRSVPASQVIMVGGTAYAMLVPYRVGMVISNVYVQVTSGATTPTLFKAGIFSLDGTIMYASSASQHALFSTNGVKPIPLLAPWTVPADGGYMIIIVATAATLPTLQKGQNDGVERQIGTGARPFCTAGTGLSDLPATPVTYAISGSPVGFWVGAK